MRWWTSGLLVLAVAGCASQPQRNQAAAEAAFGDYWYCTYGAARPYMTDSRLDPHEAAMRAQAACYSSYLDFQAAKREHVRSVVPSSDYGMATTLADQAALKRRKGVTERLTRLIADARR